MTFEEIEQLEALLCALRFAGSDESEETACSALRTFVENVAEQSYNRGHVNGWESGYENGVHHGE